MEYKVNRCSKHFKKVETGYRMNAVIVLSYHVNKYLKRKKAAREATEAAAKKKAAAAKAKKEKKKYGGRTTYTPRKS